MPSASAQGNLLVFAQPEVDTNLYRLDLAGAEGKANRPFKVAASSRIDDEPSISSDGAKIVFTSMRSGTWESWICNSDGSNCYMPVFPGITSVRDLRWSPDGRRVGFVGRRGEAWNLYVGDFSGGAPRELTAVVGGHPNWSREGRSIYFTSGGYSQMQIWRVPAEGGTAIQLTRKGGYESCESPDGRFLYYVKELLYEPGVFRLPVDGGEEVRVLDHERAGVFAGFDKGICLLHADPNGDWFVEIFNFATQRLSRVATLPKGTRIGLTPNDRSLAVSPDGRWILYVQLDHSGNDIMLVENFR